MIIFKGVTVQIKPHAEYRNKYEGELGIVENTRLLENGQNKVGIRLSNFENARSATGLFWFDKNKIEIIESEENMMLKGFKVAGICFLEGSNTESVYPYALYDEDIQKGDIVVVQSGHHGLGIAQVENIDAKEYTPEDVKYGREIIAKVDFTAFNDRKAKAERVAKLKLDMDSKVKELQHFAIYEMLAEKDPALKAMLEEFKALTE